MRVRESLACFGVALMAVTGVSFVATPTASALASSCTSDVIDGGNGSKAGRGRCSWVRGDTKVRVTANVRFGPDSHSEWFWDMGVDHQTSWVYPGSLVRDARIDQVGR